MNDKAKGNPVTAQPAPQPVEVVDYDKLTTEQLQVALAKAVNAKDWKTVSKVSRVMTEREKADEKAAKDKLLTELVAKTDEVKKAFDQLAQRLIDSKRFDGAEGIWYANDFGEKLSACRLTKGARKAAGEGGGGKSSYVANPAKSAELLAKVGGHIYIKEVTTATIDKNEVNLPAGMTYQQAYDLSTNGGWRNRVRMALLKEAGIIS